MKEILQYLKDIRRINIYTALYLKEIKGAKAEAIEDQVCDIDQSLDSHFQTLADSLDPIKFNTDSYWKDQEVRVSFLYLQDLIFEHPDEDPAVLATRALQSARHVVKALKAEFND